MALYFYFNATTGDLVYSDQATYSGDGYTSLGQQTTVDPSMKSNWIFNSERGNIKTVTKDVAVSGPVDVLTSMCYMFDGCSALISLDLSGFDTSNVTRMNNMFGGCSVLTSLDLSSFDTSNVTKMNNMFWACEKLASLNLSGFNTSKVTNMNSMFSRCRKLTSLDLSDFDTSNVTRMSQMFTSSNRLKSLDLSNFNTSKVTNMSAMFSNCEGLTSLDLSGFDTSNVIYMGNMFSSCPNLVSLDLSGFDTSKVTDMSGMFGYDEQLRIIDISSGMSNVLSQLPADQYYPAAGGDPVAKASLTAGTWVRDEADLSMVTSIVEQAQMSQAISRRIGKLNRDLRAEIAKASVGSATPSVDVVRTDAHSTSYTKDTLEIVTDSTGKVTEMYFVSA